MSHNNSSSNSSSSSSSNSSSRINNYHKYVGLIVICNLSIIRVVIFLLIWFARATHTRRLNRCELAGQLYILDVPKSELPLWLCIADYESRFNTHVIGQRNDDGSSDYGIFQISDRYWCEPPQDTDYLPFNECNINCTELILDDITQAVTCANLILKQHGWSAWSVYEEFCNGTLYDIDDCFQ